MGTVPLLSINELRKKNWKALAYQSFEFLIDSFCHYFFPLFPISRAGALGVGGFLIRKPLLFSPGREKLPAFVCF